MLLIRPLSDARFREWRMLGKAKYRKKTGLFVAEGIRTVQQIIRNGRIRPVAFVVPDTLDEQTRQLLTRLRSDAVPTWGDVTIYKADRAQWGQLSDTETPQPLLAVCSIPAPVTIDDLLSRPTPPPSHARRGSGARAGSQLLLALDAIQDPGNLGTILRTASWFGVAGVVCGEGTVDAWNPKVVRSTAGATGQIDLASCSLDALFTTAADNGWTVVALDAGEDTRSVSMPEYGFPDKCILLVGNEAHGISPAHLHRADVVCRIPGSVPEQGHGEENVESLNAAMALGIAMYAWASTHLSDRAGS